MHPCRAFADVACRSEPLHADVLLALIEMGQTTAGLREYAFRFGRRSLNNPGVAQPPKATQILHTGDRKPRSKLIAEMCPEYPGKALVRQTTGTWRYREQKSPFFDIALIEMLPFFF